MLVHSISLSFSLSFSLFSIIRRLFASSKIYRCFGVFDSQPLLLRKSYARNNNILLAANHNLFAVEEISYRVCEINLYNVL